MYLENQGFWLNIVEHFYRVRFYRCEVNQVTESSVRRGVPDSCVGLHQEVGLNDSNTVTRQNKESQTKPVEHMETEKLKEELKQTRSDLEALKSRYDASVSHTYVNQVYL